MSYNAKNVHMQTGFVVMFTRTEDGDSTTMFMGTDGLPRNGIEDAMLFPSSTFAEYCANYDHTNIKVLKNKGWTVEVRMFQLSAKITL